MDLWCASRLFDQRWRKAHVLFDGNSVCYEHAVAGAVVRGSLTTADAAPLLQELEAKKPT